MRVIVAQSTHSWGKQKVEVGGGGGGGGGGGKSAETHWMEGGGWRVQWLWRAGHILITGVHPYNYHV